MEFRVELLEGFAQYLRERGYIVVTPKEPYKVLQATRPDREFPVMVWRNNKNPFLKVMRRDFPLVTSFLSTCAVGVAAPLHTLCENGGAGGSYNGSTGGASDSPEITNTGGVGGAGTAESPYTFMGVEDPAEDPLPWA